LRTRHLLIMDTLFKLLCQSSGNLHSSDQAALVLIDFQQLRALTELTQCAALDEGATPFLSRSDFKLITLQKMDYKTFHHNHMLGNFPALIDGLTDHWIMRRLVRHGGWLKESGEVDMIHLAELYRPEPVKIQHADGKYEEVTFGDFAELWSQNAAVYLKDWHFFRIRIGNSAAGIIHKLETGLPSASSSPPGTAVFPLSGNEIAPTPALFCDDWVNEFLPLYRDTDYRFVYMGRKGTRTRLHRDVLNTFSWSVNVTGVKRWLLFPPTETRLLYDIFGRELAPYFPYPLSEPERAAVDWDRFPLLRYARPYEIIQNPGEAVFVPSGWYHTVENLEDAVSVNANWFNSCNLAWCEAALKRQAAALAAERVPSRDAKHTNNPNSYNPLNSHPHATFNPNDPSGPNDPTNDPSNHFSSNNPNNDVNPPSLSPLFAKEEFAFDTFAALLDYKANQILARKSTTTALLNVTTQNCTRQRLGSGGNLVENNLCSSNLCSCARANKTSEKMTSDAAHVENEDAEILRTIPEKNNFPEKKFAEEEVLEIDRGEAAVGNCSNVNVRMLACMHIYFALCSGVNVCMYRRADAWNLSLKVVSCLGRGNHNLKSKR
jgi:hypothetical protein